VIAGGGQVVLVPQQPAALQVVVGEEETHAAPFGDLHDLVQVAAGGVKLPLLPAEGGPGQQAPGKMILGSSLTQEVHGLGQVGGGSGRVIQPLAGPCQGEVAQADVGVPFFFLG
jgi:hypothetical protein